MRRAWMVMVVLCGLLGVVSPMVPAVARPAQRQIGDIRVLARVPDPGQPAGVLVHRGRFYVTTLGLAPHDLTEEPRVFGFGLRDGRLQSEHHLPMASPIMAMAAYGVAADADGRLYVVDMNGAVVRLDPRTGRQEIYAEFPARFGGLTVMPFDIAFAPDGTAYVSDQNLAGIWRIPPGTCTPELWFQDPRLAGYLFGPSGLRLDPRTGTLTFVVASSNHPATPRAGLLFRLPVDDPRPDRLQELHRYPAGASPFGVALGKSGRIYVTLAGAGAISIVDPDGTEHLRLPQDGADQDVPFDRPVGAAFGHRGSLLVTNSSHLNDVEEHMVVFDVHVGDRGLDPVTPTLPPCAGSSRTGPPGDS